MEDLGQGREKHEGENPSIEEYPQSKRKIDSGRAGNCPFPGSKEKKQKRRRKA